MSTLAVRTDMFVAIIIPVAQKGCYVAMMVAVCSLVVNVAEAAAHVGLGLVA